MRLEATGLEVRRGPVPVLAGVDIAVDSGEIVGIVGANGAGKSTLLATLAGLLRPWRGTVRLDGTRVEGMSPQRLVRAGLSLVPQGRRVFPGLTVRANLELGGWVRRGEHRARGADRLQWFLDRHPVLAERAGAPAGTLSGGEQGLLVLGRALMARPAVLLLDEPLMGLDPSSSAAVLELLSELSGEGVALMVVDHDRSSLASVATTTLVVADGAVRGVEAQR